MRGYGAYLTDLAKLSTTTPETASAPTPTPTIVRSPETVVSQADASAIVAFVAHQLLQGELDWEGYNLDANPAFKPLRGLTREQIDAAIAEAIS